MPYLPQEIEPVRKKYLKEVQKWAIVAAYNYYWNHKTHLLFRRSI
jgi:hypothetical protein